MILLGDCLTVLGARHGLALRPQERCASLVRCARHSENKFRLKVGLRMGERVYYAPFCAEAAEHPFDFADEKLGVADTEFCFIAKDFGVMLILKMFIPFRPQDEEFSSVPVLYLSLRVRNMQGNYRWCARPEGAAEGEVFIGFDDDFFSAEREGEEIALSYDLLVEEKEDFYAQPRQSRVRATDRIGVLRGGAGARPGEVCGRFCLQRGQEAEPVFLSWSACLPDVFRYRGEKCPFVYRGRFSGAGEVSVYAKKHAEEIRKNAEKLNTVFLGSGLGVSFDKLLCIALHSYLMNTWLVQKEGGQKIFTVWEGNCYFNSTVDVEFTEMPFYLSLFPGLLAYQLDMWPEFAKECAEGTYLCHDIGELASADGQHYPHDMPVEESADYILMLYLYARTVKGGGITENRRSFAEKLLRFLYKCCQEGRGLPHIHTANTLDDAGSAMQYGKEQVYLGMKAAYAFRCGAKLASAPAERRAYAKMSRKIVQRIEAHGYGGHYFAALSDDAAGVSDPWSGRRQEGKVPGTRAAHIYTFNTYAFMAYAGMGPLLSVRRARADIACALRETMQTYGCRHTAYLADTEKDLAAGLAGNSPKCGWLSMNIARDIAAMRLGMDVRGNFERYWEWIETANSRDFVMFMETFCGNDLHFYPRGAVLFGVYAAAGGVCVRKGKYIRGRGLRGKYFRIEKARLCGGRFANGKKGPERAEEDK